MWFLKRMQIFPMLKFVPLLRILRQRMEVQILATLGALVVLCDYGTYMKLFFDLYMLI